MKTTKKRQSVGERIAEDYDMYTGNRSRDQACADPWLTRRIDRAIAAAYRRGFKDGVDQQRQKVRDA